MKNLIFFIPLLFLTVNLSAAEGYMPYNMFNKDGVLHFDYKAEDLAPREKAAREQLEKDLQDFVAIPKEKRTCSAYS